MVRLSETEHADLAAAAREAGLTPSGYAAEAALAASRADEPPARQPLRVALAELVATRVELTRLVHLLAATTPSAATPGSGIPGAGAPVNHEAQAALGVLARVDRAATAVVKDLR